RIAEPEIEAEIAEMLGPFERRGGDGPYELQRALQQCMNDYVGIFRTQKDLEVALGVLEQLKQRAKQVRVEGSRTYNPGWHLARRHPRARRPRAPRRRGGLRLAGRARGGGRGGGRRAPRREARGPASAARGPGRPLYGRPRCAPLSQGQQSAAHASAPHSGG